MKMFVLTPYKASFNEARGLCLMMGGDIIQETLGTSGTKYHKFDFTIMYINPKRSCKLIEALIQTLRIN